jgi:hypothetical protein
LLHDQEPDIGELSIAVGLAYVDFRLRELDWRGNAPRLALWYDRIGTRPSMRSTIPE